MVIAGQSPRPQAVSSSIEMQKAPSSPMQPATVASGHATMAARIGGRP